MADDLYDKILKTRDKNYKSAVEQNSRNHQYLSVSPRRKNKKASMYVPFVIDNYEQQSVETEYDSR